MIDATLRSKLRKHPFVDPFEPAHVEKLAGFAREALFSRDHVVFHEGDVCDDFYLIVSGLVALEVEEPDHTLRIQTLAAGDELGWSALLMSRGKQFQARALEPVEALAFDGPKLLAACREDPAFGFVLMQQLLRVVASRLQSTRLQLHDVHSPVAKRAGA